jgi:hypothetical protein
VDGSVAQDRIGIEPSGGAVRVSRGRFRFELAGPADDAELCRVLARVVMPGQVQVSLRREPSYFAAAQVDGPFHQVVIARDSANGPIAAMGSRSVRTRFVDRQATPVGYLSNLRVLPEYRGRTILARGYAYFKELDRDGEASFYLTTVSATNEHAIASLTGRRAGLPAYHYLGKYHTVAVPLARPRRRVRGTNDVQIRSARLEDRSLLHEMMCHAAGQYQCFPCYDPGDLFGDTGTFIGLPPADVLVALRRGEPVGMLGCWNQMSFRQTIVEGYDAPLRYQRPWYNVWAKILGAPLLPTPGSPLRCLVATFPLVVDQDQAVLTALIQQAQRQYGGQTVGQAVPDLGQANDVLLVGMYESDPLLNTVQRFATFSYVTNVYLVSWQDSLPVLGTAPIYLELGCL